MIAFVKAHRSELERLSAAFLSVTLLSAGAEVVHVLPEQRERAADDAQRMIDVFAQETGWRPGARAGGGWRAPLPATTS